MEWLFASGRIVDLILVLVAVEAVVLFLLARSGRISGGAAGILANLAAGACLMLALRAALVGAWWGWTAVWLAAALAAHVEDMRRRRAA